MVNPGRHVSLYEQLANSDIGVNNICIAENNLNAATCVLNSRGSNIEIPKASENNFINTLLSICEREKINYLFSFFDNDLPLLAKDRHRFEELGTKVVLSSYETVVMCEDKYALFKHLEMNQINGVPTSLDDSILNFYGFPYFTKPRYGHASISANVVNTMEDLRYYLDKGDYIIQPFMKDREFGIDLLIKHKEIYDVFMKEKFAMRAGTTDKAMSVWKDGIFRLIEKLVKVLDLDGPIDIDILENDDNYFINEVNPKFGGGYPAAIVCGKNFFLRYLKDLKNSNFRDYKEHIKTVRYEKTIIADNR